MVAPAGDGGAGPDTINYRTHRPEFASFSGCDRVEEINAARARCFVKITADRAVTVTWKQG